MSRQPLIKQVLQAHRRGQHYLVICGLMPLVEGVLVDAIFTPSTAPSWQATQKAVAKLKGDADGVYGGVVQAVERLIIAGAAGMGLFDQADRATWAVGGEPRRLNRHAILHGFARRYGSAVHALKMILLLNVVVQVAD